MRPGKYQMDGNITTIRQLIEAAGGLSEDAFTTRAFIHRMKEDRTLEVIDVDVKGIMDHSVADITLKNEDVFFIPSTKLMQEERTLSIIGEINYPGVYNYAENTSLETFICKLVDLKMPHRSSRWTCRVAYVTKRLIIQEHRLRRLSAFRLKMDS